MLARIARAKQYKSGGSTGSGNAVISSPPAPAQPGSSQPPGSTDWGFLERPVETQRSGTAGPGAPPNRGGSVPLAPKLDGPFGGASAGSGMPISDDRSGAPPSFAGGEKDLSVLPDRFRAPIDDVVSLLAASQEATSSPQTGSATRAAESLRAVLAEDSAFSAGLDASMRMEDFTEVRRADIGQH